MSLLPVEDAEARIVAGVTPVAAEDIPLNEAAGRTLAGPVVATRDQPPFPASAMDGYAVQAADTADPDRALTILGVSAAGHRYPGKIGPRETVRIFTGAPVPDGADAVLIQENTTRVGDDGVKATEPVAVAANIRPAGLDFHAGRTILEAGAVLGVDEIALAAASGSGTVPVRRRPVVAILATGDELVPPGTEPGDDQIFASGNLAISAFVESIGGEALDLGIARDQADHIGNAIDRASGQPADLLITIGGVSVGDHDLVQDALEERGMELDFWKIAMRPGKPLLSGNIGPMRVVGLPGNPVSSLVCGHLFVRPLIEAMLGQTPVQRRRPAVLGEDMPANGPRAAFLRARLRHPVDGPPVATPLSLQDSSVLSAMAAADCLLIRDRHAPAAEAGAPCRILPLD